MAADFVTSWRRLIDPRTAADYYYVMLDVAGASDVAAADPEDDAAVDAALENFGVEAPDDATFVVHLSHPATYFVSIATLWVTAPLREDFEFGEADTYVSSGPYIMSEWNHEANITLVPNPEWTAGPASQLTSIEMPVIADPAQALAAYENDEIDIAARAVGRRAARQGRSGPEPAGDPGRSPLARVLRLRHAPGERRSARASALR